MGGMSSHRIYRGDKRGGPVSRAQPAPRVVPDRQGPVHAEIVVAGREILRGHVPDANARHVADDLSRRGAIVRRITVVDDTVGSIRDAITAALERGVGLVVTTGGLGPTEDDRTLRAVAEALGVPLEIHPHATELVEAAFQRLKERREVAHDGMTRSREKMCAIPVGSEPVENAEGISPGIVARLPGGASVVCVPGVPAQARAVWDRVADGMREFASATPRARRDVETPTADESALEPSLVTLREEFPELWIHSHAPGFGRRARGRGTKVTIEGTGKSQHEADIAVDAAVRRLVDLAGS